MEGKYECGGGKDTENNHKALKSAAQSFKNAEKMEQDYSIPGKKKVSPNG